MAAARPFLITSMPRRRNTSSSTSARSGSSFGRIWSRAEISVTREPQREKKSANSQPVGPAPSTTRCLGRSRRSNTWRVVSTRTPSGRANGGTKGDAPVHTSSASNCTSTSRSSTLTTSVSGPGDAALAGQHLDVHPIHPLAHTAALVQGDGTGAGQRTAQVDDRHPAHEVNPVLLGPRDVEHRVGRRQQRLARDRIGHRAVAAELLLLDQRDVGAEERGSCRSRVPGRSST